MNNHRIPFYAKASLIFIGLWALIGMLYVAQSIIVPLIYSIIIAIVLNPLVYFFQKRKINKIWAIIFSILVAFLSLGLIVLFLYTQMSIFTDLLPKLTDKFYELLNESVIWASKNFNISTQKLNALIAESKADLMDNSKEKIGTTLNTAWAALIILVLIPVYVFMILFYQPLLLEFISKLFGKNNEEEVTEVLLSTKTIIQKYLFALLIEAAIVAVLNSVGLLIIGIKYAIMIGIIGAILNAIPFIGGILSVVIPVIVALVTKSSAIPVVFVLLVYGIIQFIDNHYIIPKVVASKVKINALISLIVVLVGSALWGVAGMFLSIPLTAILKVICDHIEILKPWGFLLGDTMPATNTYKSKR